MKIIFLDLDGVLNSETYFDSLRATGMENEEVLHHLDPEMVERLNVIIEKTDSHIVISSTWRKLHTMEELKGFLFKFGFKYNDKIIGITPSLFRRYERGYEIDAWFKSNDPKKKISKFCILDDNDDMVYPYLKKNFVLTTWKNGMQDKHMDKAIAILRD